MPDVLYSHAYFYIVKENASIPWVKIFTSDCDEATREAILKAMLLVEQAMREFYSPDKINIALFGNYVPHVHIHVMARFSHDSHFPESMWGIKQREGTLALPDFEAFVIFLHKKLKEAF